MPPWLYKVILNHFYYIWNSDKIVYLYFCKEYPYSYKIIYVTIKIVMYIFGS